MSEKGAPPVREYVLLVLLSLLWGGSFTLIKVAVAGYPPATLVAIRILAGGLVLAAIALAQGVQFPTSRRRWAELFLQGVLQSALPFTLISWGEIHLPSGLAGVMNSTVPMFVFLISVLVLGAAPFVLRKFLGVVLGLAGVAAMAGLGSIAGVGEVNVLAVLAVLAASVSYACGALFGHRFDDQPAIVTASTSLLCGSLLMVPLSLWHDKPWTLTPSTDSTLAVVALALLSTALASTIFFRLIKTLGSLATTTNAYLRAIFSVFLGVVFLGEPLGWNMVIGTGLILLGVALVTRAAKPALQPVPAKGT
ncbi:MAG: EamA family transporter [Pseudomonadota bacterium]